MVNPASNIAYTSHDAYQLRVDELHKTGTVYFAENYSDLLKIDNHSNIYMFRRQLGDDRWEMRESFTGNLLTHDLIDAMPHARYLYWNDLEPFKGYLNPTTPNDPPTPELNSKHFKLIIDQGINEESVSYTLGDYEYRLGKW